MSPHVPLIALRRALLLALLILVVLFDPPIALRPVLAAVALAAGACTLGLAWLERRRTGAPLWRVLRLWPGYALYVAGVALSAASTPAPNVWPLVGDQVWFVLIVWAVAEAARPSASGAAAADDEGGTMTAWLAVLLVCLALALLQIAGPRSGFEYGRPYHYRALQQWSGYPELGVLCLLGGAAAWALCLLTADRLVRGALAVLAAGFAAGIVFVQSRAALAVLAAIVAWTALAAIWRWRSWLGGAVLIAGVLAVGATLWRYPDLTRRIATASAARAQDDRPLDSRGEIWRTSWTLVRTHPLTGVGPGQFQRAYAQLSPGAQLGVGDAPAHAHSLPLHLAAEYGVPTMVCFLAVWGRLLWRTWRASGPSTWGVAAWACHAMLLAFFLRSLVDHFLGGLSTSLRMLALVAFVFGLAEAVASRRSGGQRAAAV